MSQHYTLNPILQRLSDADSDFRFMALNDLFGILTSQQSTLTSDPQTASRVIDGVIKALDDANGEVQNLAVKCLAPLSLKIKETQLAPLLDRLATLSTTSQDPSIPSTALRLIIASLPRYSSSVLGSSTLAGAAQTSIQRVVLPKLLVMLRPGLSNQPSGGVSVDAVDVLIEVVKCFGDIISAPDLEKLQTALLTVLENDRCTSVVKKRAVTALSLLCVYAPDELLSSFVSHLIMSFRTTHITPAMQKLLVSVTGALSRTIPRRFGPYLITVAPFILAVVDGHDLESAELGDEPSTEIDEVREGALAALESFQAYCPGELKYFTNEVVQAGMRFLKYDPNYAAMDDDEDEDQEMGGTQLNEDDDEDDAAGFDDDEYEEDGGTFSDEDDISWKVRRCSAKLLNTFINTRAEDLLQDTLYKDVAPLLVRRFTEREENVRLEILTTTNSLVKKTGDVDVVSAGPRGPNKKRRRGSDLSMIEPKAKVADSNDKPTPRSALQKLLPKLGRSCAKLLKSQSLSTKQATINLLSSLVNVLSDITPILHLVIDPVIDAVAAPEGGTSSTSAISAAASGTAAATATSLRIEALKFLSLAFANESAEAMQPYLSKSVDALKAAVDDRFYKISSQALVTINDFVELLTPDIVEDDAKQLHTLFEVVLSKITQTDADLEVRERAIEAMGSLLTKTSGTSYISPQSRSQALNIIIDRLRNETTRLTTVRAMEGLTAKAPSGELSPEWVSVVVLELGAQLRKANRALRGSSLATLKALVANPAGRSALPKDAATDLVAVLTPLLSPSDLHLCGPALQIISYLVEDGVPVNPGMINALCSLGKSPLGGAVLESLLGLVHVMGSKKQGNELMSSFLQLGINGETPVVAKVIGTLLVSGGDVGEKFQVQLQDFVREVGNAPNEKRKCLALMVLGEAGLRMRDRFPIEPQVFLSQFHVGEEIPIAAAVALGRAGAGNVNTYLVPIINQLKTKSSKDHYLLLHSIKEIIQNQNPAQIKPYAGDIWANLFAVSQDEESKNVAAECVGRLTVVDPVKFLPELQKHLRSSDASIRGMVISAIRYTFTDTQRSYDEHLRPVVIDFLTVMVDDKDIDNRKLALTALNSAAHNKPHLIMPHLHSLLPLVYRETVVKPELVREVQMGPFKHKVDDGLDLRKSAYETLYALVETSFPRMNAMQLYDRVVAGLSDEHDIRVLCNLMLGKLVVLSKEEAIKHLDDIADCFKNTLSTKPKENAVKQELEKQAELVRSVLRATIAIERECESGASHAKKWASYYDWVKQNHGTELNALETEEAKASKGGASVD